MCLCNRGKLKIMKKQKLIHREIKSHFDNELNEHLETGQWHVVPHTLIISIAIQANYSASSYGPRSEERYACIIEEN